MKEHKKQKRRRPISKVAPAQGLSKSAMTTNLDHRKYGAWYLPPRKWEKRFHSLSDPLDVEIIKARRQDRSSAVSGAPETSSKPLSDHGDSSDKESHSVAAFAEFIKKRKTYEPPPFLKKMLKL